MPVTPSRSPRRVLTIAGSDSGGGAGIQADLKTFAAHGVHGLSAVTAVTAQNTMEVRAVAAVPPEVVAAQIDAVLDDFGADAVKIGMLWSAETVRIVAARLRAHGAGAPSPPGRSADAATAAGGGRREARIPIVLDPVLAAETGTPLLDAATSEAIAALVEELLPMATLVTPNVPELARLASALRAASGEPPAASSGSLPSGEAARLDLARQLAARGPAVLAKGGHDHTSADGAAAEVVDLLLIPGAPVAACPAAAAGAAGASGTSAPAPGAPAASGERVVRFAGPRLRTRATHGTGCTLSAAVAARLAAGEELPVAVAGAIEYVRGAMAAAQPLGGGAGPLAHFHAFQEPHLERS
ncbi:MAG TPA: bifunctional hydroxymethylpyrimidine kinase/phosphomethylpyrimidine kinase [Thermoanaerobaculia bacterium]|nr:bifunctional hydroxymethylpyrimidine kinase/phosphomethylpyrimidine kinase [Thermoanaerobaculia bacterium]